jgi:hypothetical protein
MGKPNELACPYEQIKSAVPSVGAALLLIRSGPSRHTNSGVVEMERYEPMSTFNTDEAEDLIEELSTGPKAGKSVLTRLLTPEFMADNTDFPTFGSMMNTAKIKSEAQLESLEWDEFVALNSEFDSWQDMLSAAREG